jgi:phospholipase/carboxylesterase
MKGGEILQTTMVYEIRKPKNFTQDKKYPALFIMHGMGSNEQDLPPLVSGLEDTFFIFSIRGHLSQPPGFAFFTIEGYGKPHREVFDDAVNRLTNFIENACGEYPLDKNQIYLLGFSQGAILSMTLGLTLGDRVKGIVALSGYIPKFVKEEYEIKPVNNLSLFISHGEMDPVLPFEWGIENSNYFNEKGAKVTFKEYPVGHTVSLQNHKDFMEWLTNDISI